jgi:hypothetical protein
VGDAWIAAMNRHWYLDWAGPRPERELMAVQEAVLRDQEAHDSQLAARAEPAAEVDAGLDGVSVEIEGLNQTERTG